MRVVVFGAAGGTGRLIVVQALARGHEVTAVVRTASRFRLSYPRLQVAEGDALKPETYAAVLRGRDAVISALGISGLGRSLRPMTFHTDSARLILRAMGEAAVTRYLGVSSVGVLSKPDTPAWYRAFVKPLLRHKYADMLRMEAVVREASLDWTIVRPVQLVTGALTETYRVGLTGDMERGTRVSREDVASFMVKSLEDPSTYRRAVAISD